MIYLGYQLILSHVLPEWHSIDEMILIVEPIITYLWISIAAYACRNTSNEESAQQNEWQEAIRDFTEIFSHCIVSSNIFQRDKGFLGAPYTIHCLP